MEEVGEKGSIAGSLLEELMVGGEVMKKEEAGESSTPSLFPLLPQSPNPKSPEH